MATGALELKKAIYEAAKSTFPDTLVSWGYSNDFERKNVFLEEVIWENTEWGPQGGNRPSRTETVNVKIYFGVIEAGAKSHEVEEDAFNMMDTLETALRDDPTLSGKAIQIALVPDRVDSGTNDNGASCLIEASVRAVMRI